MARLKVSLLESVWIWQEGKINGGGSNTKYIDELLLDNTEPSELDDVEEP